MRFGWLNLVKSVILTCFSSSCSVLRLNCSLGLDKASPDCWFTASILAPHPVTEVLEVEAEQCAAAAARSIMGPCLPAWSSWDPDSPHAIPKTHTHGRPPSLSHIHKASTSLLSGSSTAGDKVLSSGYGKSFNSRLPHSELKQMIT